MEGIRIIEIGERYESKIYVNDNLKIIFKIDCLCGDFQHRRIKKIGDLMDRKYYADPCKHLKPFIERLEKQGYRLKVPKEMIGETKLTAELRRKLIERAGEKCENMIVGEEGILERCNNSGVLEIHRKVRGSNGGKYNMENCIVICGKCHKITHSMEFK